MTECDCKMFIGGSGEPCPECKEELTLCRQCFCMTKTIKGKCGKCGGKK
jgi:hypothetical protein